MRVLVTGASGFIGHSLVNFLSARGISCLSAMRDIVKVGPDLQRLDISCSQSIRSFSKHLSGVDVVIHCAASTGSSLDKQKHTVNKLRDINTVGTADLAQRAQDSGVKRFIFISSIKVNGDTTSGRGAFHEGDTPAPKDEYGLSKYEAERAIIKITQSGMMEFVIIRPPLVYGPCVRGNFRKMINLVKMGMPLPFKNIDNKRSFLAIDNLLDFIACSLDHPKAANEIFLLSDKGSVSTPELCKKIAILCDIKMILFPFPTYLVRGIARLFGKDDISDRLYGDLEVDNFKSNKVLGWSPKITMDDQLSKMQTLGYFATTTYDNQKKTRTCR